MGLVIDALINILSYNLKKIIGFNLPISDIIIYSIMFGIVFFKVIKYNKLDNKEKRNFYINLLPILGVIGTFLGICLGLANFDSTEIESSVPQLLQGLKTAFWTSFIGSSWAVFLNMRYSSKDKEEADDEEEEISLLKLQINELQKLNNNFYILFEENKKEKETLHQINKEILEGIKANNIMKEQLSQMEELKDIKQELALMNQKEDNKTELLNKVLDSLNSSETVLGDISSFKEILNSIFEKENDKDEYMNKILDNMDNSKHILENILSFKEILNLRFEKEASKDEQLKMILEKFEKIEETSNLQVEILKKIEDETFLLDDIHNDLENLNEKANSQISQLESLEKLNVLDELNNNIDSQLEEISVVNANILTKLDSLNVLEEIKNNINSQLEKISVINTNMFAKLDNLEKYDSNIFANSSKSIDFISSIYGEIEEYKNRFNSFIDNSTRENSELVMAFKEFSNYMLEENSKVFIEALNKTIRDFNINLVETFGSNFKQLNEAVSKLLDWQEHYKDTIELTTENQKIIFDSFRNIGTELDNFNQKAKGVNTIVSELALSTKEALEQNYRLNDSLEVLAQLDEQVKELLPNFMKINSNLDNNLKIFSEQTNKITAELKEFTSNLSLGLDKSKEQVSKLLEDTIKSFSSIIEKSEENNKEIVRSTSEKIKSLNEDLDKHIREKITKIDKILKEKIQETDDSLKDNLNDIIKMLGNISEKFAEDYEPLANKLREIVQLPNLIENDKKVK